MNEVLNVLKTRRSCRKYKNEQIKESELDLILEAGTYAPTGLGKQSPVIVAVSDKNMRDKISKLNAEVAGMDFDPFYGAPTVLVVLADKNVMTYRDDGNLVIGNLLNAAAAVGVDSCYIYRAREVFASEEGKKLLKEWGLPENYEGIGNVILGYGEAEGKKPVANRKSDYIIKI